MIVVKQYMYMIGINYKNMGLTYKGQTQVQNSYVKQVVQNYNRWTDQDMRDRGFYLDYDCGQYVFEHE